ncbi:MAG: helix-turn-helix domain-containing protein [Thermomicrobiales bacterium]
MVATVPDRRTMNIEPLAEMLGISRMKAYDLARRDELPVPVIRLGRRMVVSVAAVDALLGRTKADGGDQPAK